MSVPRLTETGTTFEAHLLRSARAETPPSDRKARVLALAAAGAITAATVGGAPVLTASTAAGTVKPGLSPYWRIALGAAGLGASFLVASLDLAATNRPTDAEELAPSPRSNADLVMPTIPHALEAPEIEVPAIVERLSAPPNVPSKSPAPASATDTEERERPDDLSLLRLAKRELARGNPRSALEELDALARAFPTTLFAEEASALRIEALAAAGDITAARALADRFHAEYPASPYAHRVRSLTGR